MCSQFYKKCDVLNAKDNPNPENCCEPLCKSEHYRKFINCDCNQKKEDEDVRRQMSRRSRGRRQKRKTS